MANTLDTQQAITSIKRFLTGYLNRSAMGGYVIGLSGGIDSALSATLAVEAVGAAKVLGVMLPYRTSSPASREDAALVARQLGIETRTVDISPMLDAYYPQIDDSNRLRAGNKMARERMAVLFDVAHELGRLVLGTGNRTEIALGYTTLFGDSACSVNPVGELYKTEVRQLARHFKLPENVLTKAPSADLWVNQTDEGEIGVTYAEIDAILVKLLDEDERSMAALEASGLNPVSVSRVVSLLNRNAFKRLPPPLAPLGRSAIPSQIQLDR